MGKVSKETMTQEEANYYFNYCEDSGKLYWKEKSSSSTTIGEEAGCIKTASGYRIVGFKGRLYRAHRIIWLYVYGEYPHTIDHINHMRDDNRLCNLRNVTQAYNIKNCTKSRANTSGFTGVSFDKSRGLWMAHITFNGKLINLGRFSTKDAAIAARKQASVLYGFHENHGGCLDVFPRTQGDC